MERITLKQLTFDFNIGVIPYNFILDNICMQKIKKM